MKHINRTVTTYIRDECDKLPFLSKKMNPDLKAIAIDGSTQNIIKVRCSTCTDSFLTNFLSL